MEEKSSASSLVKLGNAANRIAGLDGLRAIAIIAVLLFHAELGGVHGGYLGVDLFFVISGFLITGIVANEIDQTGRLSYRGFYVRRAKRLLPAVFVLIPSIIVYSAWFAPDALGRLPKDALASLLFLTNWHLLFDNVSYFEAFGRPPLLKHLWSLAIEEQFYVVWAIFVGLGAKFLRRSHLALIAASLALLSAAWMAAVAVEIGYPLENSNSSRLYFGTDTHAFPLLMGAALGFAWQPLNSIQLNNGNRTVPAGWALTLMGLLAIACFLYLALTASEQKPWLYPWGFLLAGIASLVMIMAASDPASPLGGWLDCMPLRWVGERSYGIYLWHWPIFVLIDADTPWLQVFDVLESDSLWLPVLRIFLTLLIAALSYGLVENPIRKGLLGQIYARLRTRQTHWQGGGQAAGVAIFCVLLMAAPLWLLNNLQDFEQGKEEADKREAILANPPTPPPTVSLPVPKSPSVADFLGYESRSVTAVGDSVLLGSSHILRTELPYIDIHATQGWQAADFIKKLEELKADSRLREVVLLHLGTNGYVYKQQLLQMMRMLEDRKRVIVIDSQVPRRWMKPNNHLFEEVVPEFSNAVLVRWSNRSEGQRAYFVADRVHLTSIGQRAYLSGILEEGGLIATPAAKPRPVFLALNTGIASNLQFLFRPYHW
ncbi:hypothetical protein CO611_02310 [Lysobacteraceae bacterium NML03-0222]|nr:hypothetical protein CO611_02310 [Xanthomonadaceae bacterium NML03-0222]